MAWTRALHFKHWADTQDARHTLPLLIRRLVRSVVPNSAAVLFPAMEQVQRPGLDGFVEIHEGNQFVPSGKSAWEMGVSSDKTSKANTDYEKRTAETPVETQKDTTFVFVTPREWRDKDEWATTKKEAGNWKNVVVLDANDLEHWIELCPVVDVWFSTICGRRPDGVIDLAARWDALSQIASHPLTPQVFLTSRTSTCTELLRWLCDSPKSLVLKSGNAEDGLDFLAAFAVANLDSNPLLERLVVIGDVNAWRLIGAERQPIILIAAPTLALRSEDVAEAVDSGHHVLICAGRTASPSAPTLLLPRLEAFSVKNELENCGFDNSTARSLTLACCGSSSVLKRLLTKHPQTVFPEWSKDSNQVELAPFALLGGWVHVDPKPNDTGPFPSNTPIDLTCVEAFTEQTRESLEALVARWSVVDEPLFISFRNNVVVGSREDAWHLLGSAITPQVLRRFEDLAGLVLDEDNPALDLEAKDRWMANLYGKTHSLSGELRDGILESLVLMAVYPTAGKPAFEVDFRLSVRRILEVALPEGASWKRWATFDSQLQLFVEADPDFLLSRIEADLRSPSPEIPKLFENGGDGIFSSSIHCGLLWALEIAAWSPPLLNRVTEILAELVEIERTLPRKLGNRPSKTLCEIYLWWMPHTNASIDERITQIRRLRERHADTAWSLLIEMLPGKIQHSDPTEMPRWRNWAVGWSREKANSQRHIYGLQLVNLVIETADHSPMKWSQILESIFRCNNQVTEICMTRLSEIADAHDDENGRSILWKELQKLISRHQEFSKAEWAFDSEIVEQLSTICDRLKPNDSVELTAWLFEHHPKLPEIEMFPNVKLYDTELESRRIAALKQIISERGWDGVRRLIDHVPTFAEIGRIVGSQLLLSLDQLSFWNLIAESDNSGHFAASYLAGLFHSKGFDILSELKLNSRSPELAAKALCALPFDLPVWTWMESHLDQIRCDSYWHICRGFVRTNDELSYVIERLLRVRRPFTAADILQMALQRDLNVDEEQIFQVLESGLAPEANNEAATELDFYATQQLIKKLQDCKSAELLRLARLEWGYLPVLDPHSSDVQPKTLISQLKASADLYFDLVKVIYRGAADEPSEVPLSESEEAQLEHAQKLLEVFSDMPGTDNDGSIDESFLVEWTTKVRSLANQFDRVAITDIALGQLFARYPKSDAAAPPSAICRILESIGTDSVFDGFFSGMINSRNATGRSATSGGRSERELAQKCREVAVQLQLDCPRVSKAFNNLAESYEISAKRDDVRAERRRLGR